jgi:hypothetical protein
MAIEINVRQGLEGQKVLGFQIGNEHYSLN